MQYTGPWMSLDSWAFMDFGVSFSFSARIELVLGVFLTISAFAFMSLILSTSSTLEVLFWSELLLVTSICALVTVCSFYGLSVGPAHGVLLLTATAVEAAVGMMLVLETSNMGISQRFETLTRLRG